LFLVEETSVKEGGEGRAGGVTSTALIARREKCSREHDAYPRATASAAELVGVGE
jgi:hypothetical protein